MTEDQRPTLWSEAFGECCHSNSGAASETLYHYIDGTHLLARQSLAQLPLHILEIGLGTGLGFKLTRETLASAGKHFIFSAVELDGQLAQWSLQQMGISFCDSTVMLEDNKLQWRQWNFADCQLNLLIGDARQSIPLLRSSLFQNQAVDAIYQDAFSPKHNPALWTTEWFTLLSSISNTHCLMATYSASKRARKSMLLGGWQVYQVPGHGQKRQGTRACLGALNITQPTDWELIHNIILESKTLPFDDNQLA
jgi:tRNA U34 5-methylaminomethyl-2-thiouridine-forming methyltransferase MnmC